MEPPFEAFGAIECPLSMAALAAAIGRWITEKQSFPLALHIASSDTVLANQVLDRFEDRLIRGLALTVHPEWPNHWWSVGTRQDYGYGNHNYER